MRKIRDGILQKIADFIIERLKYSNNQYEFEFWYNNGLWFDDFVIYNFGVYLE